MRAFGVAGPFHNFMLCLYRIHALGMFMLCVLAQEQMSKTGLPRTYSQKSKTAQGIHDIQA